ncbi:hypothetical protein Pyn_00147 [Prunus yedoensis var. nudiflora]|uniref:Uncharacterized protein n=1 Tax=Prunus yedoensis var. nudiflora TaxID=2094558 RepID=A0A314Z073_PRUYE|nr:hypothetical protein Pyn_00147 [Prunus yedoensis var. nudiflora]
MKLLTRLINRASHPPVMLWRVFPPSFVLGFAYSLLLQDLLPMSLTVFDFAVLGFRWLLYFRSVFRGRGVYLILGGISSYSCLKIMRVLETSSDILWNVLVEAERLFVLFINSKAIGLWYVFGPPINP